MTRIEAPQIWQSLVEVNRFGSLSWQDPELSFVFGESDPRIYPEKYIAMSGSLRTWDSGDLNKFNFPDYRKVSDYVYEAEDGVTTGVVGLLQASEIFSWIPSDPDKVVLVGAISDKSLMCTLEWIKHNGWTSETTLVDKSPVSLKHIEQLRDAGFFEGSSDFELVRGDVLDYYPEQKQGVIISDLTNVWAISRYSSYRNNPYQTFSKMLNWANLNLSRDGVYLSRCVVYPEKSGNVSLNNKFDSGSIARASFVKKQLGDMDASLDEEDLLASMTNLFENAYPASQCGLEGVYSEFIEHPTLEGEIAELEMRQLHYEHFSQVEEIKVLDLKSGATYLNFACRK